jgi:hypothetical protein
MLRAGRLLGPGVHRGFLVRRRMIPETGAATFLPPTDAGYVTVVSQWAHPSWVWLTLSPAVAIPFPLRPGSATIPSFGSLRTE